MNVAVLVDIIKETKSNWRFIFESPLYDEIKFVPGQLVQLLAKPYAPSEGGDSIKRNYSFNEKHYLKTIAFNLK